MSKMREAKQHDIFNAAMTLFSEKGFDQASMDGIAKLAQVSKRTLYKYFPTKDKLFETIVESLMSNFDQHLPVDFDQSTSISDQLFAILSERMSYLLEPQFIQLSRLVSVECMRQKRFAEIALAQLQTIEGGYGLRHWAKQGVEQNKLSLSEPLLAIEQLIGSIKGTCYWPSLMTHQKPVTRAELNKAIRFACDSFESAHSR
ncbi:TetR/AcrR family transcriptional regulator [Vibrio sp. 188UL20-2]|uniref:TetR/AcrR family transcriptional regulator n=2 Tax=Vibrio ulleungensis TaxID=2807619 RepID=A0ABS2HC42_9VIBR|nr:TetR/AcrR family transcriptional regulator [Vibrio ulleungensis]